MFQHMSPWSISFSLLMPRLVGGVRGDADGVVTDASRALYVNLWTE